jgi:nitrile hydratase beta subunit
VWFDGCVDGIHDLGGMQGFGAVEVESDEPVFHHRWEGRTFALAGTALFTLPDLGTPGFRHAIERMDPAHYLGSSYYEHWLTGAATALVEAGVVNRDELEARAGPFPLSQPATVTAEAVDTSPPPPSPRFAIGDAVRVRDVHFGGHTRCPRYVRGHRGTIVRVDGAFPVPEIEVHCREKVPETTYGVRFTGTELWGDDSDPAASIFVDLYERYLEPV